MLPDEYYPRHHTLEPDTRESFVMKRCPVCGNFDQDEFIQIKDLQDPIEQEADPDHWQCIMCGEIRKDFECIMMEDELL